MVASKGPESRGSTPPPPHNTDRKDTAAPVDVPHRNKDEDKEKEEDVQRPGTSRDSHEKPLFPNCRHPGAAVPLVLSQSDAGGTEVPFTINRYLRDYQREGIKFIYGNYIRSRGCILGDDMGLGKTVQVIGFLGAVLQKIGTWQDIENNRPQFLLTQQPSVQRKPKKVFLIVAPLSVVYNWKDELDTWGHFQCVLIHGLKKEEELARIKNGRSEIALTTYETLRLCLDQFNSIDWSAVIVDEAHKLKNPKSQITQAMKELKCQVRLGLTGTILQNNLEELWCVMDWAIPGCLGSLGHFKNKFSDPIEQGQRHSATKRALATGRKAVRALAKRISRWFLRRTKALIKEQLPKKDDRVVYCSLTDFQQAVYQMVLDDEDVTLLLRSSEKCDCRSGRARRGCCYKTNSEGVEVKELYFTYLAILRKVANHVALLQSTCGTSKKQAKYVSAICQKVFQKFPDFMQRCKQEAFEAMSDPVYSGKMKVLQKLLNYYMKRRDKVLIFSLSTKLLDVLESYCMAEGLDYTRLDGSTKPKDRVRIVKDFNSSRHTNLCLVSTLAGGLGLNFVGANVVVLFDPTWNPANDLQAIDRAYRLGQCRDVTVLRLVSLGTLEEIIYLRQVYKQQLQSSVVDREHARRYFEAVQGTDGHKGELFGIKNLFRLQTKGTCLTRSILEREGRVEADVLTSVTHQAGEEEKEEERMNPSEPGKAPPLNASKSPDETSKENAGASPIPKGLLDFSSGSEDEEGSKPNGEDVTWGGNASTSPGSRVNLLQCGFSRLLQRMGVQPGSRGEDSSQSECESGEGGDWDRQDVGEAESSDNKAGTSPGDSRSPCLPRNGEVCVPKSRMNMWDISSGSDGEDGGRLSKMSDCVGTGKRKQMTGREESDSRSDRNRFNKAINNKSKTTVPGARHVEDNSESDDLDISVQPRPRVDTLNPRTGEKESNGRNRKRRTKRARSSHTEDIESFTSSDEEHTPFKKGRSSEGDLKTLRQERPTSSRLQDGQKGQIELTKTTHQASTESSRAVSFTALRTQRKTHRDGTIDSVLGGVTEVVYTHSNQRVVGGSKAEERISKAALRDVFDRNVYSQLPANHLLGTQVSLSEDLLDSPPRPTAVGDEPTAATREGRPSADHPVTFTTKAVHQTRNTTVIIGQTPLAIRRRQLEEMASKFGFRSARQFAEDVLRSGSNQRVARLRQHYCSLDDPELAEVVSNRFPKPLSLDPRPISESAPRSPAATSRATKHRARTKPTPNKELRTKRKSAPDSRNLPENIPEHRRRIKIPESQEPKETLRSAREHSRTKRASVSSPGPSRAGGGLGSDRARSSAMGPGEAAAFHGQEDRGGPSSPTLGSGPPTTPVKPSGRAEESGPESRLGAGDAGGGQMGAARPHHPPPPPPPPPPPAAESSSRASRRSALTDLIGDTSILDDLFRTKPRAVSSKLTTASPSGSAPSVHGAHGVPPPPPPPPPQRSTCARKDFWEILNDGNEESINRLTDLSEVERVCTSTSITGRTRPGVEEGEGAVLWKANDKFLWKK